MDGLEIMKMDHALFLSLLHSNRILVVLGNCPHLSIIVLFTNVIQVKCTPTGRPTKESQHQGVNKPQRTLERTIITYSLLS